MKHRVFLIAALFACVLGGLAASAEDAAPSSTPKGKILEEVKKMEYDDFKLTSGIYNLFRYIQK